MGRATVLELLAAGDVVFTCGKSGDKVVRLREDARAAGAEGRLFASTCDVRFEKSIKSFVRGVVEPNLAGLSVPLTGLVNCAGMLQIGDPLLALEAATFDATMATHVRGAGLLTREVWPLLEKKGGVGGGGDSPSATPAPIIVNVGSVVEAPGFAQAFHSTYAISKAALRSYSVGLRQEAALFGVRVVHLKVGTV